MPKEKNQRGFSPIIVVVIAGLLIAGVVAGYYYVWEPRQQELSSQKPPLGEEKATPTPKDEIADWRIYKNEKYGFSLTFPERWEGYQVDERNDVVYPSVKYIDFKLKSKDGRYKSVFIIGIYPKDTWKLIQSEEGPKPAYFKENNNYIFSFSTAQDDEGFVGFPEVKPGEKYKGPIYDAINEIKPTFKFLQ